MTCLDCAFMGTRSKVCESCSGGSNDGTVSFMAPKRPPVRPIKPPPPVEVSPLSMQIGGQHYKGMKIQPITFIMENNIPWPEGNVIKYVCRWKNKNGVEDLKKARHILDMLIEHEEKANAKRD